MQASTGIVEHVLRTLGMFALTGDPNARHDVAGLPMLGWPLTLLAVVGLVRLWRRRRDGAHALILWSLPIFLLPPLIATEGGSPHFLRSLGLAAPLAVTLGLGGTELVERGRVLRGPGLGVAAGAALTAGLAILGGASGLAYLERPVVDRYDAYSFDLTALASAATAQPSAIVIVDDYDAMSVRFLDAGRHVTIVPPGTDLADTSASAVLARSTDDLALSLGPI